MDQQTLSSDDARTRWRDVLDAASAGSVTVIERYGKPTAAVIPFEDYAAIRDEIEDLRAARRAEAVLESWRQNPSRARPYEEVRAELVADGLLDE
jgi:prevent-host-death family protein